MSTIPQLLQIQNAKLNIQQIFKTCTIPANNSKIQMLDDDDMDDFDTIDVPVCVCAENMIYFHIQCQEPPVRVFVGDCEFWQHSVGLL